MTSNDGQIDLLIRRLAPLTPAPNDGAAHLDADEMSAFAEGALPPAARTLYVSHLAECDQCRRQVADLAIASGAMSRVSESAIEKTKPWAFWATLAGLFSPVALRYAAFASVLVIVAGVTFVALRRQPEAPNLIATNEPTQQRAVDAIKPASDTTKDTVNPSLNTSPAVPAPSQAPAPPTGLTSTTDVDAKVDQAKAPETAVPLEAPKEIAKAGPEPMKKGDAPATGQSAPYAPAPPGESQSGGRVSQGQTQTGSTQGLLGGFKQSADKSQAPDRERDAAKDQRLDDTTRQQSNQQANQPVLTQRRAAEEKQKGGPSRNMDNNNLAMNRAANEARAESPRKAEDTTAEEAPQTRSAGGRKFVRQGNRWVDQKFKSSMSLKDVSRGSDEFAALDSGLRSIAQQLGGEVIVVWKGKAYLIK